MTSTLHTRFLALAILVVLAPLVFSTGALAQQDKRAPAPEESKEPPRLKDRGATGVNNPPSGLWGSSPDSENDGGLPKATGSAYNYTHIALGAGVIACAGIGLILLIRRNSAARKRTS